MHRIACPSLDQVMLSDECSETNQHTVQVMLLDECSETNQHAVPVTFFKITV